MPEEICLTDLGEWELIRRLGAFAPPNQFVDDGAMVQLDKTGTEESPRAACGVVISTDVLVEGLHFNDTTMDGEDVGWKAATANLSDLAAMGCHRALGLTIGLVAPPSTPWKWVEAVYRGMKHALEHFGGELLGGDCSGGKERILAVTALGHLPSVDSGAIRRTDGQPGDVLVCTGPHGLSRLGLALLLNDPDFRRINQLLPKDDARHLYCRARQAHQRPRPRFDAVQLLETTRPTDQAWRVAGCDSSDGLAAAVTAIATASGCGAVLERHALPLVEEIAHIDLAEKWCLSGGEDFELVLALEPAWASTVVERLPGATQIGELVKTSMPGLLYWKPGGEALVPSDCGYSHFQRI